MLVKVRNDDPSRLSATEQTVVNWLKSWRGAHALPGIAVVKARGTDAVVWTPDACVVVSVKGFSERVTGTLTVSADQPWTLGDGIAPLEGQVDGTEAMTAIRERTAEIEELLRSAPGREHVTVLGIVLIIPLLGTRITLDKGPLPEDIDVVVGDGPSSLRTYFTRIGRDDEDGIGPVAGHWDASQVGQALGALGYAAAASYSELISEGFPAPDPNRTPPPPRRRPERAVPVTPPADAVAPEPAPRPVDAPEPESAGAAPQSAQQPPLPLRQPGASRPRPAAPPPNPAAPEPAMASAPAMAPGS
ncbi:hypothetical protein EBN03_21770, partial [Nocardia stercoris]